MPSAGISLIGLLMFSGNVILSMLLAAPPRDLASLLDPKTVLTELGCQTDEASLIAIISAQPKAPPTAAELEQALANLGAADFAIRTQAAKFLKSAGPAAQPYLERGSKSDDPEVRLQSQELLKQLSTAGPTEQDTDYLKRLCAIRMLEQMKSRNALPALTAVAKGNDPMLSSAASDAVRFIQDKPLLRPAAAEVLKVRSAMLPADAEAVLVLDMARDAKDQTLASMIPLLSAEIARMTGPDSARKVEGQLAAEQMPLRAALCALGNVRVDAVVITMSNQEQPYFAFIIRGLCHAKRVAPLLALGRKQYDLNGHTVCFSRDMEFCLLDERTLVYVAGPNLPARTIEKVISPLTAANPAEHAAAATLDKAFELVLDKKARFAVAGSLSDVQKENIRASMQAQIARMPNPVNDGDRLRLSVMQVAMAIADVTEFVARPDAQSKLAVTASFPGEQLAGKLNTALSEMKANAQKVFAKEAERIPQAKAMAEKMTWENSVRGKDVSFSGDIMLPLFFGGRAVAVPRSVPAPRPVQIVPEQ